MPRQIFNPEKGWVSPEEEVALLKRRGKLKPEEERRLEELEETLGQGGNGFLPKEKK